jgi:hypothetical protein
MNLKPTLLGTIAYTFVTFPLAIVWHIILFKEKYNTFGYFEGEPSFVLGLITILIQGFLLSLLFPYVKFSGKSIVRGLKYSVFIGMFFWTSHVLAFVAKQVVDNSILYIVMESFYLLIQFGVYGVLIGLIYKIKSKDNS